MVRRTAIADGTNTKIYIEQEPGSSGKALIHHFQTTVLPEFHVEAVPATDGKLFRAQPMLAAAEAGKVKLVKGNWNSKFIEEFGDFPGGSHDDQIDNTAIAYTKMSGKTAYRASWGRDTERRKINSPSLSSSSRSTRRKNRVLLPNVSGATWRV